MLCVHYLMLGEG